MALTQEQFHTARDKLISAHDPRSLSQMLYGGVRSSEGILGRDQELDPIHKAYHALFKEFDAPNISGRVMPMKQQASDWASALQQNQQRVATELGLGSSGPYR